MPIQVAAHGFQLTDALKEACTAESKEKMQAIAVSNFSAKWTLSLNAAEHVAHVTWGDGSFHGDATARSADMYSSVAKAAKIAHEQMKKMREKRFDEKRHRPEKFTAEEDGNPV